ncbi:hypothetical protein SKAU_G00277970 [Synaphobranchus kaupii]|uniref:Uncharacterized protein n=1 Tax=Synaphobranchus kaupii TaxID=118154 RepID=A0A9Q1EWJ0_SYNKA|nr:hypothetical protein SKAU_G00277970 [Synaphobranchus kaupii]
MRVARRPSQNTRSMDAWPHVEGPAQPLLCYSGHLQHSHNQLSQRVLGQSQVKDSTKPGEYTGELIGIEYLYSQTGRVLQDVSLDPDTPDEAAADIQDLDEGFQEYEDPTVHYSAPSPMGHLGHRVRLPIAPQDLPWGPCHQNRKTLRGPDGQPGYQLITRLAGALRGLESVSENKVDELVRLWSALPDADKGRLIYPSQHQDRLTNASFSSWRAFLGRCEWNERPELWWQSLVLRTSRCTAEASTEELPRPPLPKDARPAGRAESWHTSLSGHLKHICEMKRLKLLHNGSRIANKTNAHQQINQRQPFQFLFTCRHVDVTRGRASGILGVRQGTAAGPPVAVGCARTKDLSGLFISASVLRQSPSADVTGKNRHKLKTKDYANDENV